MDKDFKAIAKDMMENSLFAQGVINWGVLSTDGKLYYSRKRSIVYHIMTSGSTNNYPCDSVDVNASNYSDNIYKSGNMYIRVINKDKPVSISK